MARTVAMQLATDIDGALDGLGRIQRHVLPAGQQRRHLEVSELLERSVLASELIVLHLAAMEPRCHGCSP